MLLPDKLECLCLWILFSSSELCDEDDGSTSETPESAGLGGSEPEQGKNEKKKILFHVPPNKIDLILSYEILF